MKRITVPSDGRSCTVNNYSPSSNVDGSSQSGIPEGEQETSFGSPRPSDSIFGGGEDDSLWGEIEYLLESLSRVKAQSLDGTDWDPCENYWLNERYTLCRKQALHFVLCLNLQRVLNKVSFPGEHLTYLQLAERVMVGCKRYELREALKSIGFSPGSQVYFKAEVNLVPVERAEQILLSMRGDAEYVLAQRLPEGLGLSPNSATYKNLRKLLEERGWKWGTRRVQKIPQKVIVR